MRQILFLTGTPPSRATDPEKVFCTTVPCSLDFYYLGCCPKCGEQFGSRTYRQSSCRNLCRQEDGKILRIFPDKGVMIRFEGEKEIGELEFTGAYTGKLKKSRRFILTLNNKRVILCMKIRKGRDDNVKL